MHFLATFLRFCVVIVIPNIHVKDHFQLTKPFFSESDVNMSKYGGRSVKTAILLFVGFLKTKNSRASFSLIFENI